MAIMIPSKPKEFSPNSLENIMFDALEKLPESYYVFHSLTIAQFLDGSFRESETDFVVFHPQKGILCIEAKAGQVQCEDGQWLYGDGRPMSHGGPFKQADRNKFNLMHYIDDLGLGGIKYKCKFFPVVWFPSITKKKLSKVDLPTEANINLILCKDSIDNINEDIENIFNLPCTYTSGFGKNKKQLEIKTTLTKEEANTMLERVLAPTFNLISIPELKLDYKKYVFKNLLKEQIALLNYLEEQKSAVINGLAGTGKTVMAVHKAQINARKGEKVLFLCYNVHLKNHLKKLYQDPNIDFYTIAGLSCWLCKCKTPDYKKLHEILENMYFESTFPYKHIVIDEGQDFGKQEITETDIINTLKLNVIDNPKVDGSFYLFYDKNQMIQSYKVPSYIKESDCKLTLYRNCRNTQNIAKTSLKFLGENKEPKLFEGAINGDKPSMFFCNEDSKVEKALDEAISSCCNEGYSDIQILTCITEEKSVLANICDKGIYVYKDMQIPFTTCRKYKGLEADVVIMVDLNTSVLSENSSKIMYVGTSRARYKLMMIANLNDDEIKTLATKFEIKKGKKLLNNLAEQFNANFHEFAE